MSEPSAFRWLVDRLERLDPRDIAPMPLLAASSWLLADGSARGLDAHRERFLDSLPAGAAVEGHAFWDAAIAALPRSGTSFPRLEFRGVTEVPRADSPDVAPRFVLRVRPAPELRRDIALVTHDGPDPRRAPTVKGPDLERLADLRAAARERGADDAVLLASDGSVAETTTANLAWWHGDALCVPDADIPQLRGVTVGALIALATALGIEVRHVRATPADLDGREIWALNAVHGIRIITAWPGGPDPAAEPGRLTSWRRRLDALRRPLPERVPA